MVSSEKGLLGATKVHESSASLNTEAITVKQGETIDFIVDIDSVLNSDQYVWKATIKDMDASETATAWDSAADFPTDATNQLTPLEQLAQILFCSNEFLFVD